jgi:predicted nuclease of predicted toxin-antitoxin system
MRLFADENIPKAIVDWLRSSGHDVSYASEEQPGERDPVWLDKAESDQRLILTSDKDFGELVFRDRLNSHGVVLLRLGNISLTDRIAWLERAWPVIEAKSPGKFIVVTAKKVRVRPLPS